MTTKPKTKPAPKPQAIKKKKTYCMCRHIWTHLGGNWKISDIKICPVCKKPKS